MVEDMRVMVLADSRSFHTERYVQELSQHGCQVLTVSLEAGDMPYHSLRRHGPVRALHYPLAAAEVGRLVDEFRPDLLNPHFASGYGFLAALATRKKRLPILLHVWGSDILIAPHKSYFHRRKTRLALESANFVIGDSDYVLSEAGKIGTIQERRTIVWGIERACLEYRRADFGFGRPIRIIVPRPHEQVYNNPAVVRSLAGLIRDGEIEISFPAWGSLRRQFNDLYEKLVGRNPVCYDKLPRASYLKMAAEHDIYLSASRSDSSPASLLEAMGLGILPIVGDIAGVREWLTTESGYLFDLSNERTLYEIVSGLIASGDSHELMRTSNIERVEQKAIFEDNMAETVSIMREIVKRGRTT